MRQFNEYTVNYAASLLSAFNIAGTLIYKRPKGLEFDAESLLQDQKALEEDYRKACTRVMKGEQKANE